jgi:hypothetical protein
MHSLVELFGHLGLLPAIGRIEARPDSAIAVAAGLAIVAGVVVFAWLVPKRRTLALTGLGVAIASILPVLPGGVTIAGTRYAYGAGIGVAFIVAAVVEEAWERSARRKMVRIGLALCVGGWIAVQTLAIRSVESWRFAPRSQRFERLIASTDALRGAFAPGASVWVVAPAVWNVADFAKGVGVLLARPVRVASVGWSSGMDDLERALDTGGRLDRATHPVFTSAVDGTLYRLEAGVGLPLETLRARARASLARNPADSLPIVELVFDP